MNRRRTRLWWADRLRIAFAVLLVLAAMLAKAWSAMGLMVMCLVLPAFLAVEFTMNRCPHCDRYLDRNWSHFCQHCGGRIREDKTDT